jgi:hypothetical protein
MMRLPLKGSRNEVLPPKLACCLLISHAALDHGFLAHDARE